MKKLRLLILKTLLILVCLLLCSCEHVVENSADELRLSDWCATLENESELSLGFDEDYATFEITNKGLETVCISGLYEISERDFVIHDEKTSTPFAFSYIVHFDRVEIVYGENTVSLYKS